jgi:hypothetical protein
MTSTTIGRIGRPINLPMAQRLGPLPNGFQLHGADPRPADTWIQLPSASGVLAAWSPWITYRVLYWVMALSAQEPQPVGAVLLPIDVWAAPLFVPAGAIQGRMRRPLLHSEGAVPGA